MEPLLTCNNSLKLKRPQAAKAFRAQIDKMYEEINAEVGPAKL
jgi:long-chain acyl-CoA synthetase